MKKILCSILILLTTLILCSCNKKNCITEGNFKGITNDLTFYLNVKEIDYEEYLYNENENVIKEVLRNNEKYYKINLFSINETGNYEYYNFTNLNKEKNKELYTDDNANTISVDSKNNKYVICINNINIELSFYEIKEIITINNYERVVRLGISSKVEKNNNNQYYLQGYLSASETKYLLCNYYEIAIEFEIVVGNLVIKKSKIDIKKNIENKLQFTYLLESEKQGLAFKTAMEIKVLSVSGYITFNDEGSRQIFI